MKTVLILAILCASCALQPVGDEKSDAGHDAAPVWLCSGHRPHCPEPNCSIAAIGAWLTACWSDGVPRPEP
jgi:hypothetical protein